jgi:lipopolysaccharide transport system permease protein
MHSYLTQVWNYRHFWLSLVRLDLRTRYRRSVLGVGWSLLQPLTMTLVFCVVFQHFLKISAKDYVPHLLTGLVCWNFLLGCALQGCQSFFQGEPYIRQCPLPLAVYPLRTAIGAFFHLLMGLIVLTVVAAFMRGAPPVGALFSLLPTLVLLFAFGWSLAVLFGSANVFFQDTQHLAEVGFQLCFYLTPIIYRLEDLKGHHLAWLLELNPFVQFMELIRSPLLHHQPPSATVFLTAMGITALTVTAAGILLRKLQDRLVFFL